MKPLICRLFVRALLHHFIVEFTVSTKSELSVITHFLSGQTIPFLAHSFAPAQFLIFFLCHFLLLQCPFLPVILIPPIVFQLLKIPFQDKCQLLSPDKCQLLSLHSIPTNQALLIHL